MEKFIFLFVRNLEKFRSCWNEGVESPSDGVQRIHWTRIVSDGKVYFSIRERLNKVPLMLDKGVESH